MSAAEKILIVEDDASIAEMVQARLEREGFEVTWACDGKKGWEVARSLLPSLILLDLTMPVMNGLEVCRLLRQEEKTRKIPIIIVTGNGGDDDVTIGLEMGADDYVSKPFSVKQLVARIRAVLRRSASVGEGKQLSVNNISMGPVQMDARSHEVINDGVPANLTITEFGLLWALAAEPGRVFTRDELLERISKHESDLVKRNIDVHVMTLRKKLGPAGQYILTVRGLGYKVRG